MEAADERESQLTSPIRTPWVLLAALGLAVFASVSAELLPPALVLGMSATLDVTATQIGLLVTVWAISIIVGTLPLARVTARVPRRSLLVAALLLFAAMNVVTAVVPVYLVVMVARIVAALMAGLSWTVIFGYVPTLVPPEHLRRAMSVVLGGGTLASALGVPLGAFLSAAGTWQFAFVGAAGVLLAAAGVAAWELPSRPGNDRSLMGRARSDSTAAPVFVLLVAGALLLTGYMTVFTYIVPVLTTGAGAPVISVSGILLPCGLAGAVALISGGVVGDRWPRTSLFTVVSVIPLGIALILWSMIVELPIGVPISGTILVGFGIGGMPPLFQALVVRTASPSFRDTAAGLFVVVLNAGIAAGSAIGGLVLPLGVTAVTLVATLIACLALMTFAVAAATIRASESGEVAIGALSQERRGSPG